MIFGKNVPQPFNQLSRATVPSYSSFLCKKWLHGWLFQWNALQGKTDDYQNNDDDADDDNEDDEMMHSSEKS